MLSLKRAATTTELSDSWSSFLGHVSVVDALIRMKATMQTYRSRLRRFVFQHKDAALLSVSHSAEIEAEALYIMYSDLSGFLVRYSSAELERRSRVSARRTSQAWERVRVSHIPSSCASRTVFPRMICVLMFTIVIWRSPEHALLGEAVPEASNTAAVGPRARGIHRSPCYAAGRCQCAAS